MKADTSLTPYPPNAKPVDKLMRDLEFLQARSSLLHHFIEVGVGEVPGAYEPDKVIGMALDLIQTAETIVRRFDSGELETSLGELCGRYPFAMILEHHIRQGEDVDRAAIKREIDAMAETRPDEADSVNAVLGASASFSTDQCTCGQINWPSAPHHQAECPMWASAG